MASAQPSTSTSTNTQQNTAKMNKETMKILKRVFQKCDQERKGQFSSIPLKNYMERAARYTGLHIKVLGQLRNHNIIINDVGTIDRSLIYNEMLKFYLIDQILPTTGELFNALHGKIPLYVDIKKLRKLLLKMGYMWKYIPKYTLVVVESPKVTFERYFYLKNLTQYREENRPILFVAEKILRVHPKHAGGLFSLNDVVTLESGDVFDNVTFAVSKTGVYFLNISPDFEEDAFEGWVNEHLAKLPSSSVVVLQNSEYNSRELITVPNQNSLKIAMQEWLDYNNIPYSVDASKVELLSLIDNYTDTSQKLYKVDSILKHHGHTVLRLPQSIDQMTPVRLLQEVIKKNFSDRLGVADWRSYLQTVIESLSTDTIEKFDCFIAAEEKAMLCNDIKIDQAFESLVNKMENVPFDQQDEDSDLPTFSDSE